MTQPPYRNSRRSPPPARHNPDRRSRVGRHIGLLTTILLITTSLAACSGPESQISETVQRFLDEWHEGSIPDHQDTYDELTAGLGDRTPELQLGDIDIDDDTATANVQVTWHLAADSQWEYETTVDVTKKDDSWQVRFDPATVHPELQSGDSLLLERGKSARAAILDNADEPITRQRPVVVVGVHPAKVDSADELADKLGDALDSDGIDTSDLPERIENSDDDGFVKIVTLRKNRYQELRSEIHPLPGTVFREETRMLAPTKQFAHGVLGTVDPATKEDIADSDDELAAGDTTGHGGLQEQYDTRLRGSPAMTIRVQHDGDTDEKLFHSTAEQGDPVTTTIDPKVQKAADKALAETDKKAALVAIDTPSGQIRAVGNSLEAGATDLALGARVAPGSTFKMITGLSLLDTGDIEPDTAVKCPENTQIAGYEVTNAWDGGIDDATFRKAFAQSCNTAFAQLSDKLEADTPAKTARTLGIGRDWNIGLPVFTGDVSTDGDKVARAARMFGQGDTQVSPMSMAAATAAVAHGKWQQPSLVTEPEPENQASDGPELPEQSLQQLRSMMRDVVKSGTATKLANASGDAVSGKTGTAEYGDDDPPRSHSWFVGIQDELAFAVFVRDGGNDDSKALEVSKDFLDEL